MTINEAIKHCEEKAEEERKDYEIAVALNIPSEGCFKRAEEQEQLAEWLKELKSYRECDLLRDECSFCGDNDCICKKGGAE